jgi:5'-methylthioadenosine phosphorylase
VTPSVGIVTGSGMEELFPTSESFRVKTGYGTVEVYRCSAGDSEFLVIPRHGKEHSVPPHRINFKANISALQSSGVREVIATSAVGSISKKLAVGEFGLLGQFIDMCKQHHTFFDERPVHTDMTNPYDVQVQRRLVTAAGSLGMKLVEDLVYVCVDGPRYETAAEIRMFGLFGGDVVGMTGAPEAILCKEAGLRYASVAVATNWAAGIQEKVSHEEVVSMMAKAAPKLKQLLESAISS